MLKLTDGQCGLCEHFGENHPDDAKLVRIRIQGEAPEDLVEACGLPENAARNLKVTPISGCAGYSPARRSA